MGTTAQPMQALWDFLTDPIVVSTLAVIGVGAVCLLLAAYVVEYVCDLCDPLEGE